MCSTNHLSLLMPFFSPARCMALSTLCCMNNSVHIVKTEISPGCRNAMRFCSDIRSPQRINHNYFADSLNFPLTL